MINLTDIETIEYISYIENHKQPVTKIGRELGLKPLQLAQHDLSKFRPDEFYPMGYAKFYVVSDKDRKQINKAIVLHRNRNKHHPEFWGVDAVMPEKYIIEMLADWMAMSLYNTQSDDMTVWLENNIFRIQKIMHPETFETLNKYLEKLGYVLL